MKAGKRIKRFLIPLLVIALMAAPVSAMADEENAITGIPDSAEVVSEESDRDGMSDIETDENNDIDQEYNDEDPSVTQEDPTEITDESSNDDVLETIDSETEEPIGTEPEKETESDPVTEAEEVNDPETEASSENGDVTEPEQDPETYTETEPETEPRTEEPAEEEDPGSAPDESEDLPENGEDQTLVKTEEDEATVKPAKAEDLRPTVEKYGFGEMDGSGNATFFAEGVTVPAGLKKIKVAIWRNADKSDKKFYAFKNGIASFNIEDHDYLFGIYKARLYIWDKNGKLWSMDLRTKKYAAISASAGKAAMTMSSKNGKQFKIKVTNVQSPRGINQVKALVWSESNKSNKKWYTGFKADASGNYTATGSLYYHKHKEGKYHVSVYVVDNMGTSTLVASATRSVKISCGEVAVSYKKATIKAAVSLADLTSYGLIDHVEYAVWKEGNDQKDLKWFTAEKGDGDYAYSVNMRKFSGNGTYNVHCYAVTKSGENKFLAGKSFKVSGIPENPTLSVARVTNAKVKLTVKGANINGIPAESVKIAVWSNAVGVGNSSAQDDVVWYAAKENEDGSFSCTVNRNKHLSSGKFSAHAYAYVGKKDQFQAGKEFKLMKTATFAGIYATVARNCILAVETGGQIYGNARYDDFTEAYHISAAETGITIGAGQWMGINAVKLLLAIREADEKQFKKLDSCGISIDLDNLLKMPESSWNYYGGSDTVGGVFKSGGDKAKAIQKLISSATGIAVQNSMVENNIGAYIVKAASLGVEDMDAQIFMANVCHLGGSGAMTRIVNKTKSAGRLLTMENLWSVMQQDVGDLSSSNQVGDTLYQSRHLKIIGWIYEYLN